MSNYTMEICNHVVTIATNYSLLLFLCEKILFGFLDYSNVETPPHILIGTNQLNSNISVYLIRVKLISVKHCNLVDI